jgi:hypothetical protein
MGDSPGVKQNVTLLGNTKGTFLMAFRITLDEMGRKSEV